MYISSLKCSQCYKTYAVNQINTFAACAEKNCQTPLVAEYRIPHPEDFSKEKLKGRVNSMWRYHEMLPILDKKNIVSLGEGMTPILSLDRLAEHYQLDNLQLKDESLNPTGSFKSRGLSMAISKAKELNIKACIIPTAGNAGGALSAYCAKADIEAVVVMPRHAPEVFKKECQFYGAQLILVDGLIDACGKKVAQLKKERTFFDVSTLKEPYRLEGKKTMGYEIAEQMHWSLPDVILYPTGGGTGLIGIWKAFKEMLRLGWISGKLPKMIAVQAANCQPMVRLFQGLPAFAPEYQALPSVADGLAVPKPFGKDLIMQVLAESGGQALAISEKDILSYTKLIARSEGILVAPEGGALLAATLKLLDQKFIQKQDKILLLNTGSGYKYMEKM